MFEENIIVLTLLSFLVVLVILALFFLVKHIYFSQDTTAEPAIVLEERLHSRKTQISSLNKQLALMQKKYQHSRNGNISLRETITRQDTLLKAERKQYEEKIELLENAKKTMAMEFKILANDILEKKSKTFTDTNERNIQAILKPLNDKIQGFEKKVEESYNRDAKERFSLLNEIKNLQDLNSRISTDAINLTNALKGESKTQGTWGEVILERVLEKSGLNKGREYEVQVSLRTEDGQLRQPDVIVHLPDNKHVIIDSKLSLNAYERYSSSTDKNNTKDKVFLNEHLQAIRSHIKTLSNKEYQNLTTIQSLDFVLMFLPIEAAFSLAVEHDNNLCTEAFEKNIIIVGPTTLLATLRTIQNVWRYDQQNKNAVDIAIRAGALYDKFVAFSEDLNDVGKRLDQTQVSYDQAYKKLIAGRGNLLTNVEKLKELGARASKKMPDAMVEKAALERDSSEVLDVPVLSGKEQKQI